MIGRGAVWVKREEGGLLPSPAAPFYMSGRPLLNPNPPVGAWPLGEAVGSCLVAFFSLSFFSEPLRTHDATAVIFLASGDDGLVGVIWVFSSQQCGIWGGC